jgi:arsenate reductase
MSDYVIYHNPRCSKSRQTLNILQEHACNYEIFLYLEIKLTNLIIKDLLKKLNMKPRDLLRKSELDFKNNNLESDILSDEDLINFMIRFPKIIERPIVIKGNNAVMGRPPENVLELL